MSAPADLRNRWHLRRYMMVGYATLFVMIFGVGAWAAVTRIAGAVVTSGQIEVEGNRQVIQHPIGGVIETINARDGDEVNAGDVLIRLEGQELLSDLGVVEGQWFEILARKGRLSSERDGLDTLTFDKELTTRAVDSPEIKALMEAQQLQFDARMKLKSEEDGQFIEQQEQIGKQIDGLLYLQTATDSQIDLLQQEIKGQETLLAQGLTQITRVLTPQRELARLKGSAGQVEASIFENRGKIAEIGIERVRLDSKMREEAIGELRDLEFREIELREKRRTLLDQIAKLELRAPVGGIVYNSTADTVRGVIRAAEPVLYIVPKDTPLIVRTRIEPIHIDQIHPGQEAILHFSGFDLRTTPELVGHVRAVSADVIEDTRLGTYYYRADIEIDASERGRLGEGKELLPGMPVEAFIRTEDRSPLSFMTKPFTDYFTRAFREG